MKMITRKLLAVLMAAVMLCLLIPVGAVSAADNLLVNGDFEDGKNGWAFRSGTAEIVTDTHSGSGALSLTDPGQWGEAAVQTFAVEANTQYSITWYSKRVSGTGAFNMYVMNANGYANLTCISGQNWMNETSGQWVKNEYVFDSGSATSVLFKLSTEANKPGTILLDDIVVAKVGGSDAPTGEAFSSNFDDGETQGWSSVNSISVVDSTLEFKADASYANMFAVVKVEANTDYVITFDAKSQQANHWWIKLHKGDWSGDIGEANVALTTEWDTYSVTLNTGNYTSVLLMFQRNGDAASGQTAWFDNITMIKSDGSQPDTPDTPDEPFVPVEGNFVKNGDFETGDKTGWNLYQNAAVDAAAAKTGNYGLYLQGNGGWGGMGEQVINGLQIGTTYRISLWYKALSAGVNIQLAAGINNSGEKLAYIYGTKTEWTQFAVEFEATTTSVCMAFVGSGTGTAEKMYVDDITLTEVKLGGDDNDPNLKMIDTLVDNIKTQGRTSMVKGTLMLDFSISGVEFELDCAGDVYATFNVRKLSSSSADGGLYFTIVVDGQKLARDYCHLTSVGETKVKLASNLSAGKHTFAIYRQSEHHFGEVGICALSYDGQMLAKPANKDLYIEFIGDSISCGFGNLGSASQGDGAALWSDGTQAYTYLTAQALNADWSNVAWSGIGCKYGYGTITMQDVYPVQRYNYDKTTLYDFSNEPNIVVLALGTNDNSIQGNATLKREGLVEMLTLVREKNPNAPIVWIHGMMTSGVSSMIEEIVAEFGGAEAGYYACRLTQNNSGGGSHPNLAGQKKFADELVAFLETNGLTEVETPDTPVVPDIPDEPDTPVETDGLLSGGEISRMEMTEGALGLAFRFNIHAQGITMNKSHEVDLSNATVTVDGVEYKLLEVGALVTNDANVGLRAELFNHDSLSACTKAVSAALGNDITEDGLKYAVRVTNIPAQHSDWILYARGYYVYECDGEQVIVYGGTYCANYDNKITTNDVVFGGW